MQDTPQLDDAQQSEAKREGRFSSTQTDVSAPDGRRHSLTEDIYALFVGAAFIVIGVILLYDAGLVTGGMAGMALLFSYLIPVDPSLLFMIINIPFFVLGQRVMGWSFTVKTFVVNLLIMLGGALAPHVVAFDYVHPVFAALFAGTIIGMGILALARHAAGVGGSGILALSLQKTKGWNAGRVQLIGDCLILGLSLPFLNSGQFVLSVLSAAAINGVLIVNHKPGRYLGY